MKSAAATVQLKLGKRKLSALRDRARRVGLSPEGYLKKLLDDALQISADPESQTFAGILGPGEKVDEVEVDRLVRRIRRSLAGE